MADVSDPRTFFSQHHEAYVTSARHARGKDLDMLLAAISPRTGETALDVATGGGHTALRLAQAGLQVTAADITAEMLHDTAAQARDRGLVINTVEAYAESLPFADETFDVVTCRRAAHHFRDVGAFLAQVRRVLTPRGRLGISDMTGSVAGADWLNQLERLRDSSHNQALSADAWYHHLVAVGFSNITLQIIEEPMGFEEWLAPVTPTSGDGNRALAFLRSAEAPLEFVRGTVFVKRRLIISAYR